jgi:hypothetical protein
MRSNPPDTIEELLRKKRTDHVFTMKLARDICKRIKLLEKRYNDNNKRNSVTRNIK